MNVCASCRVEMQCVKTGVRCVFGTDHVYAGDKFRCPSCGGEFIHCNDKPYHDPVVLFAYEENRIVRMIESDLAEMGRKSYE